MTRLTGKGDLKQVIMLLIITEEVEAVYISNKQRN